MDTEGYLAILRDLDNPVHWEFPPGYDYDTAERRFLAFAGALQAQCGRQFRTETSMFIQDASFLGQIFLDAPLLRRPLIPPETVLLRVSNWGNLASLTDEEIVRPDALEGIVRLLEGHGYRYVPPDVLALPYTGQNRGVTGIATWWIRYFDWV